MEYKSSFAMTFVNIFKMDHSVANHLKEEYFNTSGVYYLLAHSRQCVVLYQGIDVQMFRFNSTYSSYQKELYVNFSTLLGFSSQTQVESSEFVISDDCSRIRVNKTFYFRTSQAFWYEVNNTAFKSTSQDSNFNYAIADDGNLYKFNNMSNSFQLYFTAPSALPTDGFINVHQDRLVINATTQNSAEIYAYSLSSTGPSIVLNFSSSHYVAPPSIAVSPLLTNIFVIGNGNSTNGTSHAADAFYIDWSAKSVTNITFPVTALEFGSDYFITAGE